jgi:hypothetical protein
MARSSSISPPVATVIALVIFSVLPPAAPSVAAQTGTAATIIGQVMDESRAILPGVTVTATSPALQVPHITGVTDERGSTD